MNKNVERGQATRAHLIEVATRLFATHGYDGTSIEAVLAESGVSRGSLYHHFPGKEALYLAVFEVLGDRLGADMTAALQDAADPVDMLRIGCVTWIRNACCTRLYSRSCSSTRPRCSAGSAGGNSMSRP